MLPLPINVEPYVVVKSDLRETTTYSLKCPLKMALADEFKTCKIDTVEVTSCTTSATHVPVRDLFYEAGGWRALFPT